MKILGQYKRTGEIFARYWKAYGGWKGILTSPYFLFAFVISILSFFFWSVPGWWDTALSILPNMLGFTLGGYTFFIGFLNDAYDDKSIISGNTKQEDGTERDSPFVRMNATFVHYIVMQGIAILIALLSKTLHGVRDANNEGAPLVFLSKLLGVSPHVLGRVAVSAWAAGFFLFAYAMVLSIAAVMSVFRVVTMVDRHNSRKIEAERDKAVLDAIESARRAGITTESTGAKRIATAAGLSETVVPSDRPSVDEQAEAEAQQVEELNANKRHFQ